jgi:hypothetical protein
MMTPYGMSNRQYGLVRGAVLCEVPVELNSSIMMCKIRACTWRDALLRHWQAGLRIGTRFWQSRVALDLEFHFRLSPCRLSWPCHHLGIKLPFTEDPR